MKRIVTFILLPVLVVFTFRFGLAIVASSLTQPQLSASAVRSAARPGIREAKTTKEVTCASVKKASVRRPLYTKGKHAALVSFELISYVNQAERLFPLKQCTVHNTEQLFRHLRSPPASPAF